MKALTLLFFLFRTSRSGTYDIDDAILFKTTFSEPETLLDVPNLETIVLTTNNDEKYACSLPDPIPEGKGGKMEAYSGPNPVKLLEKLFVSQACAYKIESYWTYELCHGRHLRQFHAEKEGSSVKVTEFFLGRFSKEQYDKMITDYDEKMVDKKPPTIKIENINMPYLDLFMRDGTFCDLSGQPRMTRVIYVCYPTGKHEIYSFRESSTCEYETIILSSLICEHPDFRPEESKEQIVNCSPLRPDVNVKPKNLVAFEEESRTRVKDADSFSSSGLPLGLVPDGVKIEIKPATDVEEMLDEAQNEGLESPSTSDDAWKEKNREPVKPLIDPTIVQQFLRGETCLYGGAGWWKYEFCYGRSVIQFHEEETPGSSAQRKEILLGVFDPNAHMAWIASNKHKKPRQTNRKYVSHYYSDGDKCDLTDRPRSVEVKLKCKKSDSPSAVTLYLLEPSPCEYILGVESPIVCDVLHLADEETGLIDFNAITPKSGFESKDEDDSLDFFGFDSSIADKLNELEAEILKSETLSENIIDIVKKTVSEREENRNVVNQDTEDSETEENSSLD